ncbi:MAG: tetratricopeptide repeat protein [Spirochaetaceae bacterium]
MISQQKREVLFHFAEGRKHYKLMNFEDALACFERALEVDPADGPSRVYVERCRHYSENPPPEDWDGVFVMQTK